MVKVQKLCYMDSFIDQVKTDNIYKDIAKDFGTKFGTSFLALNGTDH